MFPTLATLWIVVYFKRLLLNASYHNILLFCTLDHFDT